jgi:hypothetical protein
MTGTIIWCARVRHDVAESRSEVEMAISAVRRQEEVEPPGFIFVTPIGAPTQRLLNVDHISSVEAIPGSGI